MDAVDRKMLAQAIDHTLLAPEATAAQIIAVCAEADQLAVGAVCVSPTWVRLARQSTEIPVASVVGFPSGSHLAAIKAKEAELAVAQGASEIDMVANLSFIANADWKNLEQEIAEVRHAVGNGIVLKVILETALWLPEKISLACIHSVNGSANFVKTSTGFHKSGGATIEAVEVMRAAVGPNIGVKASGGIRTTQNAIDMMKAGANRIGASASRAILEGIQ